MASNLASSFNTSASTYERRIGRTTRAVATHIATHILTELPTSAVILDNACGTGAVTAALLALEPYAKIHAADASPGMIDIMHSQIKDKGWDKNVHAEVMDGTDLRFGDETFNASVTNFGVFFFPDPVKGVTELRRTLKEGGMAVITCWKTLPFNELWDAAEELVKPKTKFTRAEYLLKWLDPKTLESTMEQAGFDDVEMQSKEVYLWGTDLEDLGGALSENMKGFVGDDWTEEEKGKLGGANGVMMDVLKGELGRRLVQDCDIDGQKRMGVKAVAWIGVARK